MFLYCFVVLLYLVLMDLYILCTDLNNLVVEICFENKSTKTTFIFGKFSVVWACLVFFVVVIFHCYCPSFFIFFVNMLGKDLSVARPLRNFMKTLHIYRS